LPWALVALAMVPMLLFSPAILLAKRLLAAV
jgi:hypothetical protein